MSIAAHETPEEKRKWLFAPFGWAVWTGLLAIAPLFYWYRGEDNPTSTIISLVFVILCQLGCVLWGLMRLRYAARRY